MIVDRQSAEGLHVDQAVPVFLNLSTRRRGERECVRASPFWSRSPVSPSLAAAVTASGTVSLTGPGTIRITDTLVKHTHVDGGQAGNGAGDFDFYRQALYNKRITSKPIGHSDITCIDTGTGSSNCTGTYFLPKGKIMVGGVLVVSFPRAFCVIAARGSTTTRAER